MAGGATPFAFQLRCQLDIAMYVGSAALFTWIFWRMSLSFLYFSPFLSLVIFSGCKQVQYPEQQQLQHHACCGEKCHSYNVKMKVNYCFQYCLEHLILCSIWMEQTAFLLTWKNTFALAKIPYENCPTLKGMLSELECRSELVSLLLNSRM